MKTLLNKQEVMRAYNKHERIGATLPGYETHRLENITRLVSNEASGSYISYFRLHPEADEAERWLKDNRPITLQCSKQAALYENGGP